MSVHGAKLTFTADPAMARSWIHFGHPLRKTGKADSVNCNWAAAAEF
jgi:hypothetical protein